MLVKNAGGLSLLMFPVCKEKKSKGSSDLLFQGDLSTSLRPGLQKWVSAGLFWAYKSPGNFNEIFRVFQWHSLKWGLNTWLPSGCDFFCKAADFIGLIFT